MPKWLGKLLSETKRSFPDSSASLERASQSWGLYSKPVSEGRIRILTLRPGNWTDPIQCGLQEVPIQESGAYQALSYTWNNGEMANNDIHIICNLQATIISYNLYLGLRQLRDKTEPLRLWVDAICINQKDNDERTSQVGMMREIYEKSMEVVIWLGESGIHDHLGEMLLPTLSVEDTRSLYQWFGDERDHPKLSAYISKAVAARRGQALKKDSALVDVFGAFRVMHALLNGVEASDIQELRHFVEAGPILRGFDALMKQRWWSRAWIVQEVVVARRATVRYGQLSAPWKLFALAALQYEKYRLEAHADSVYPYLEQQSLSLFASKIMEIESTRNEWHSVAPLGLLPLLRKFRSRSASDERDKIFALLGLVRFWRVREWKISPNYKLSPTLVAFATTKSMLASYGSLSVLAGTLRRSERYDSNPSWVIDWNWPPTLCEDLRLENILRYNAGGDGGLIELHEQGVLKVEGTYLDEIVSMGEVLADTTIARVRPLVQAWSDLVARSAYPRSSLAQYVGGGSPSDAFWQTICGNLEHVKKAANGPVGAKRGFHRATKEGALSFEQFRSADYAHRRTTSIIGGYWQESKESNDNIARGTAFLHAVECASAGRRFFVTKSGYIGTGPSTISTGDYAFVISGSQVPFILRSAHESRSCNGSLVETLSSARSTEPSYVAAGKDAIAPGTGETCFETHSDPYYVIGDAYIHGVMEGELDSGTTATRQSIFLV